MGVFNPGGTHLALMAKVPGAEAPSLIVTSVDGRQMTTLLSDSRLSQSMLKSLIVWPEEDRLLYGLATDPDLPPGCELWEQRLGENKVPQGEPRMLKRWSGAAMSLAGYSPSTGDIAISKRTFQDVMLAPFELGHDGVPSVGAPRRLTLDEREDRSGVWIQRAARLHVEPLR